MSYYHVRITQKSNLLSDEVKLDFTLEELERRILKDYGKGRPITIGGKSIGADDIERLQISTTDLESSHYRKTVEQERIESEIISSVPVEWDIAEMGRDVTDDFITGPPGDAIEEQVASVTDPRPRGDRRDVFVVHGRNEMARRAMFSFLHSIGLTPVEWSMAVQDAGRTSPYVGEILEAAFSRAHAVVVLFTPGRSGLAPGTVPGR